MVNYRNFQISGNHFWGFNRKLDLDYYDSEKEIIDEMKKEIKKFLKTENLEILIEELEKKNYHIMDLGDILVKTETGSTIYICDHCHGNCCGNDENSAETSIIQGSTDNS